MSLHEDPISLAQLVGFSPVAKTSEHRDSSHGTTQVMVFTGPEFADAMDWTIQTSVERLSHQFQVRVCEIAGIPDLLIQQPLGGVIIREIGRASCRERVKVPVDCATI